MPRVASQPRSFHGSAGSKQNQSSLKIPLNDDRQEKAIRFQSRQALHDIQMSQLKTAASPTRKLNNYDRAASSSPRTPQSQKSRGEMAGEGSVLTLLPGNSMTPMKRVPILANFEEWMKMATDNKINATNSWNFALIDYFHDMSLLKEGDSVNFQKASCTLDGCVKIYTSRVDSVATETGKLLSGLADSGSKKLGLGEEKGSDDEEDVEDEEGLTKRAKKKTQRSSEATLAPTFAALQLKKFELEFSVDPLFKKASADFDEGGAKGLLLNHLTIDSHCRIVFDSSDDSVEDRASTSLDAETEENESLIAEAAKNEKGLSVIEGARKVDIESLRSRFFPNPDILEEQHICPSLKNFDLGRPDAILNIPFLKENDNQAQDEDASRDHLALSDNSGTSFIQSSGVIDNGIDVLHDNNIPAEADFGEGGEAWARNAQLDSRAPIDGQVLSDDIHQIDDPQSLDSGNFDVNTALYGVSLMRNRQIADHEDVLSYFDNTFKQNWAGPEHWKIRRVKDLSKVNQTVPGKRREKERFEIDFAANLTPSVAETVYTPANSLSIISLPKAHYRRSTRNLLPDDKHFNSSQLLHLYLKPKARMEPHKRTTRGAQTFKELSEGEMDEEFWARHDVADERTTGDDGFKGDYNANFFQDDGLAFPGGLPDEDEDYGDARESFSPSAESRNELAMQSTLGASDADGAILNATFGSQLVTQSNRLRPEYVQYARVAKKVDVRRLKEEMWKGIGFEKVSIPQTNDVEAKVSHTEDALTSLAFTSVMNNLKDVYPKQAMVDISTSYCFICLLHLANEKGLTLESEAGLEELSIRKDIAAEAAGAAA